MISEMSRDFWGFRDSFPERWPVLWPEDWPDFGPDFGPGPGPVLGPVCPGGTNAIILTGDLAWPFCRCSLSSSLSCLIFCLFFSILFIILPSSSSLGIHFDFKILLTASGDTLNIDAKSTVRRWGIISTIFFISWIRCRFNFLVGFHWPYLSRWLLSRFVQ